MTDARDAVMLAILTHGSLTAAQATAAYRRINNLARFHTPPCDHLVESGWLTRLDSAPGVSPTYIITLEGRSELAKFLTEFGPVFRHGLRWLEDTASSVFAVVSAPSESDTDAQ